MPSDLDELTARRSAEIFRAHRQRIYELTDRLFAGLMLFQWVAAIAAAYWVSPLTWAGAASRTHLHVWAAVFLGGACTLFPVGLAVGSDHAPSAIVLPQDLMGHECKVQAPERSRQPANARTNFNLALANLAIKQYETALAYFSQALRIRPNYPMALVQRGFTYTQLGKTDSARADFQRALSHPDEPLSEALRAGVRQLLAELPGH